MHVFKSAILISVFPPTLIPRRSAITSRRQRSPTSSGRATMSPAAKMCAPALLDVDCTTVDHMRLANALCRFVELVG
jgi:hypothetical protein